jgi:DNA-binding FadR family transcriptional regulator
MTNELRRENLTESFVRAFSKAIIRGDMQPGDFVSSEAEIAKEYGVSRSVVREGFRELAVLGLIDKRQGRLSKVASQQDWDLLNPDLLAIFIQHTDQKQQILDDLFAIRMLVECQAAADAALRHSADDLRAMNEQLNVMKSVIEDPQSFIEADIVFHTAIHRASQNLIVESILLLLAELLRTSRTYTTRPGPENWDALEQHQRTYDAIAAGDSDGARRSMWQHLEWSREILDARPALAQLSNESDDEQ